MHKAVAVSQHSSNACSVLYLVYILEADSCDAPTSLLDVCCAVPNPTGSFGQQATQQRALEALYAAPCVKFHAAMLSTRPDITKTLFHYMKAEPTSLICLTACAVFAKLCHADLELHLTKEEQAVCERAKTTSWLTLETTAPVFETLQAAGTAAMQVGWPPCLMLFDW